MNTNCLAGMRCPRCGSDEKFLIEATVLVGVIDSGIEEAPHPMGGAWEWEDDSYCQCNACNHVSAVVDFRSPASDESPETVTAAPFTARQCPTCKVWVYTDDGPFSEGDRTKTQADYLHWRDEHASDAEREDLPGGRVTMFPYFPHNEEPVQAIKEHRNQ